MPWASLGTVTLSYDWQLFNTPDLGGEAFRLIHTYSGSNPARGVLCSVFSSGDRYDYRRVFPQLDPQVIKMEIPAELIAAGLTTRYFQIKQSLYARQYSTTNWRVELQTFTP